MGGNQVSQDAQKSTIINHPKIVNPIFYKNQTTGNEFFRFAVSVVNQKEYQTWVKSLKQINWESQALMLPTQYEFQKQGMCGSSGLVTMEFENFPFLLHDQIGNRQSIGNKKFDQNQLWYLLYTLLSDTCDFHRRGLGKIGDIRPENIFINEEGQVKLATQYSWPGEQINYAKSFHQNQITYLSPEQIKDINLGRIQTKVSPSDSQAFSIGLTILDAAQLSSSNILYVKHGKFDYNMLNEKLAELEKDISYSQLLVATINNLCEVDSSNRCNCQEILQWLRPCQTEILNLDQFQIERLPNKFRKKMDSPPKQTPIQNIQPNMSPPSQIYHQSSPNYQQIPQQQRFTYQGPPIQGQPMQQNFPRPQQIVQSFQKRGPQQQIVYGQMPPGNIIPGSTHQRPIQYGQIPSNIIIQGTQNPNRQSQKMISNQVAYQKQQIVNSQYVNRVPPPQNYIPKGMPTGSIKIQGKPQKKSQPNAINSQGQYSQTLQKIEEQLNLSRQMFPS